MDKTNGTLFVISAPSGAGKTTLCRILRNRFPDILYSVSFTTRHPRAGEIEGVDYHFITRSGFLEKREHDYWAEWAQVHGNYYGTSAEFLKHSLAEGSDILLDIDVQGTIQILEWFPDAVTIFIMPPSMDVLKQRLIRRETNSSATVEKRMKNAVAEMDKRDLYRHVIVNDRLATTGDELVSIVETYL